MKVQKSILTTLMAGVILPLAVCADDYVDDIYFNPQKDTQVGASKKNSNYIENFSDIDVDAYNLRGQYYNSPIDTIGSRTASEEDFVYTQQIQKYYNPTIVLDNSDVLADVLENSYGNVEIVFNGVTPSFLPVYSYGWPYYRSYYDPWYLNVSFGGWYDPWYWGPSWSWGWGPSWSWGPSWGWGPGWSHPHGPTWHPNTTWSPGGNRPVRPGSGWAGNNRHGVSGKPAGKPAAGMGNSGNAPSGSKWSIGGNHRGSYNSGGSTNRQKVSGNSNGYRVGKDGHRYTGSGNTGTSNRKDSSVGNQRNGSSSKASRSYTNSNKNSSSRSSGSYNSHRSSGNSSSGSFGGGSRRSGGSSRGHRR